MAITDYQTSYLYKISPGKVETSSRNHQVAQVIKSGPVSGAWVTFPDGSKYRKPTAYHNQSFGITLESPQIDTGFYRRKISDPPSQRDTRTSNGGYRADVLLSSNCPGVKGVTLNKLYDTVAIPSWMENEAVTKALNDIADQKANIGENLGTFRQTTQMIKNPASMLVKSLTSAWKDKSLRPYLRKSLRQLGKTDISEEIAGRYLEYVYGWLPLMNDIHGIMELMKDSSKRPLLLTGRGKSSFSGVTGKAKWRDTSHSADVWLGPLQEKAKVRVQVSGRIDPNANALRQLNQLGLLNPASLAWDLTPWSFVVDWFVPIGPVLSALSAPAGLIFVAGSCSSKIQVSGPYTWANTSWRGAGPTGDYSTSETDASGSVWKQGYRRKTYGNWPLPKFYFNRDPFGGDRALKAIALSIVNLRKLRT